VSGNRTRGPSFLVPTSCVIAPLILLLFLRLAFDLTSADVRAWKYEVAGGIVLAWSVTAGWRMLAARRTGICRLYKIAFIISLGEQALVLALAALVLDHGLTLYACVLGSMSYWMIAGVVVARRPLLPTRVDLVLVRHGFLLLAFFLAVIVWTWQFHYWE